MLAKVTLIGNLGRDPEIRQTSNGDSYARFSIATNKIVKGQKSTQWWDVTVFDSKKAEIVQAYVTKGTRVFVEGELQTREYQSKDGTTKTAVEVIVGRFDGKLVLLGERGEGGSDAPTPKPQPLEEILDDEVPF
jgi:single-strand DNA-binding protein